MNSTRVPSVEGAGSLGAKGTAEVNSNISGVSKAAEEGGKGANEVLSVADGLSAESVKLDELTTEFLKRMRAL